MTLISVVLLIADRTPLSVASRHVEQGESDIVQDKNSRDVYDAVANSTRRKLLRILADVEELPLNELTVHFQMGRTAVSKHLTILQEAGLVKSRKVGRETRYRLNAAPLQEIQDWVSYYEGFWKERIAKLNLLLEEKK